MIIHHRVDKAIRKLQRRTRSPNRLFFLLSSSPLASFVLRPSFGAGPSRVIAQTSLLCPYLCRAPACCHGILNKSNWPLVASDSRTLNFLVSRFLLTQLMDWLPWDIIILRNHYTLTDTLSVSHAHGSPNLILTLQLVHIIASRSSAASTLWRPVAKCGIEFPTLVLDNPSRLCNWLIDRLVALSLASLGCVHNYHHSDRVCDVSS